MKFVRRVCGVIFSVALCFVLISFFTGCVNLVGGNRYSFYNAKSYVIGNGTVSSDEVSEIEVDWVSGDVLVDVSDSVSEITFSETYPDAVEESLRMHYCLQNKKLSVKFAGSKAKLPHNFKKDLTITIPDSKLDLLNIDSASGSVSVKNISAKKMELNTASADIDLRNVTTENLETNTASGTVSIKDANLVILSVKTASGTVGITDASLVTLSVKTASGTVSIKDASLVTLSVKTASGRVNISDSTIQDLSADTASGDVSVSSTDFRVAYIDTASGDINWYPVLGMGFWCEFESVSGKMHSAFDLATKDGKAFYFDSEEADYGMRVKSVSGDFFISV